MSGHFSCISVRQSRRDLTGPLVRPPSPRPPDRDEPWQRRSRDPILHDTSTDDTPDEVPEGEVLSLRTIHLGCSALVSLGCRRHGSGGPLAPTQDCGREDPREVRSHRRPHFRRRPRFLQMDTLLHDLDGSGWTYCPRFVVPFSMSCTESQP